LQFNIQQLLMMRHTILFAILMMALNVSMNAQDADRMTESCTSIMVGKLASADGSVITSHTCDARYRTWMTMTPARDYERDTVTAVYRERFHTHSPGDVTGMVQTGTIPQVRHTYRFLDTAYPCMNEKQLAMGETTISGRVYD
jgi:dipeptidase